MVKKEKATGAAKWKPTKTINPIVTNTSSANPDRKEINARNRQFGKSVERNVAKLVGGERTPGSGAFKLSNRNLTGDVEVRDNAGNGLAKFECKGVSVITPSGDKTFTMKKSVLDQAFSEAHAAHEIPIVFIHWFENDYLNDHAIVPGDAAKRESHGLIPARYLVELIRLAQIGQVVDRLGCVCKDPEHTFGKELS